MPGLQETTGSGEIMVAASGVTVDAHLHEKDSCDRRVDAREWRAWPGKARGLDDL